MHPGALGARLRSTAVILFLCLFSFPAAALGQGAIAGVVTDATGALRQGVIVEARSPELIEKVRTAVTDAAGQYRIENLRPGVYSATFLLGGFSPVVRTSIEVAGSSTTTADAELRLGSLTDAITVTGEVPLVDVHSSTRELVLAPDVLGSVPTVRSYNSLLVLDRKSVV